MNESLSNMEPENTLHNMALYDFKTPISVIFYDENSNEEINSEDTVVTKNNAGSTDTEIFTTSNIKEEMNKKSNSIAPIVCESIEDDNHFKECIRNETRNRNNITRRKRKSNDLFYKNSKIQQNINNCKKSSETPHDENIPLNSVSPNLPTPYSHQDDNNLIGNPLESISNFLIIIAESYNYHISISNKKPTKNNKEISKKHYLEIKYHFFKTAYETVYSNILPKEKDRNFIENFLKSTIETANKKTKFDTSKIITSLFAELIKWVKHRKRNESKINKLICKQPNSILIKQLSQPSILNFTYTTPVNQQDDNIKSNDVTDTTKNQSKSMPTCTVTPELSGEEISISFNTALSNNQNNKTIINNDISRDGNIRSENMRLQDCSNTGSLNNVPSGIDLHTDEIPFVNQSKVQPTAYEMRHNQTMDNTNKLPNNQNNDLITNSDISCDKNIRSQNPLPPSQLLSYLQNCINYKRLNNGLVNTDIRTNTIPLANDNEVQPNTNGISDNQAVNQIKQFSNNQNNEAKTNSDISYNKNIRSQNPLSPEQLLNYLQSCNNNRRLNNGPANADIPTDTIPLANHNEDQLNTNEMAQNQTTNNISHQQISPNDEFNACPPSMPPRHYQNANILNNTPFHLTDPNQRRFNIQSNNSTPHHISLSLHKNTNGLPNQDLNTFHQSQIPLNYGQESTNIRPNAIPFAPHGQTTSDISYPPRCYQNTAVHRTYSNHHRMPVNSSKPNTLQHITTNVPSNQDLNNHYYHSPGNRIYDNNRQVINDVRPAQPVYNTAQHMPAQNRTDHLTNLTNGMAQYLPSYVNRPISSSVVDQSNMNFLENRVHNSVQHQELAVLPPPPPYHPPVRQDRAPLTQDYVSSAIQHNMQPEPQRSRSSISTDSGFASPVACGDVSNNMESIMNDLFELEETTEQTTQLPIITHVTSLSSKVAFVKEGSCYICGKNAKEMCSGCYKIYYCGSECQTLDWRLHRFHCKPNVLN